MFMEFFRLNWFRMLFPIFTFSHSFCLPVDAIGATDLKLRSTSGRELTCPCTLSNQRTNIYLETLNATYAAETY